MTVATTGSSKLDIGRVIQGTFGVVGRNFATFLLLSLIFVGAPSFIANLLQVRATASGNPDFQVSRLALTFVSLVTTNILQGALVYGAVQDFNGQRASIADSLATGLRAFLPLIGLGILMAIALTFGFLLLVAPGMMMACAWCVAAPALVAERRGVFDSFRRSADLTRDNRWRIFGLYIVLFAIMLAVSLTVSVVSGVAGLRGALAGGVSALTPAVLVLGAVINAVLSMLGAAGAAVLYIELRRAKQGHAPEWLAEVFA